MARGARRWYWLLIFGAFACGVSWFLYKGGAALISQSRGWGAREDAPTHHLAWLFYRDEAWHFPPGRIQDYPFGVGTSIGYTDGIPWLAMTAKLFSFALPRNFQYLGIWIAFCFGMQAAVGLAIARRLSSIAMVPLALAGLLVTSQVLMGRAGHAALCGQWLVLSLVALHLRASADAAGARRLRLWGLLWVVLACGTHVYLAAMAMALYAALLARLAWIDRTISWRKGLGAFATAAGAAWVSFYLIGFFDGSQVAKHDFGEYSADLLTLLNPMSGSMLLPEQPVGDKQYEGFAYLGAGGLLVVVAALASMVVLRRELRATPWRRLVPLVACCLLLGMFALSNRVTVAGQSLFTLPPAWFQVFGVFHASGRFIWPLHYLLLVGGVVTLARLHRRRPRLLATVLGLSLALQVVELRVFELPFRPDMREPAAPQWECARGRYHHMVMYPPQLTGCAQRYPWQYYLPYGFLARRLGMTFNSAYLGRNNPDKESRYCETLTQQIAAGHLDRDSLYLVDPAALPEFAQASCTKLDGVWVCRVRRDPDCSLASP